MHGQRILHYTGPNNTEDYRRAWIVHSGAYGRLETLYPLNVLQRSGTTSRARSRAAALVVRPLEDCHESIGIASEVLRPVEAAALC